MAKNGTIGRMGARACTYILGDDATVDDLLVAAEETLVKGETITLEGEVVEGDYDFDDQDSFVIMPNTTGA